MNAIRILFKTGRFNLSKLSENFINPCCFGKDDVEKQLDWFGAKSTYRGVMLFIIRHGAEHLGQSIAYARMNGIVPPWTEEQQQQQKKQPEKPKQ